MSENYTRPWVCETCGTMNRAWVCEECKRSAPLSVTAPNEPGSMNAFYFGPIGMLNATIKERILFLFLILGGAGIFAVLWVLLAGQ